MPSVRNSVTVNKFCRICRGIDGPSLKQNSVSSVLELTDLLKQLCAAVCSCARVGQSSPRLPVHARQHNEHEDSKPPRQQAHPRPTRQRQATSVPISSVGHAMLGMNARPVAGQRGLRVVGQDSLTVLGQSNRITVDIHMQALERASKLHHQCLAQVTDGI
jgi:hypothetical protein